MKKRFTKNEYFQSRVSNLGDINWHYVAVRFDLVLIFAKTESGNMVLIKQYRPPLAGFVIGPVSGARFDHDRVSLEEFACQEVRDETGHEVLSIRSLGKYARSPGMSNEIAHIFFAIVKEEPEQQRLHEGEIIDVVYVRDDAVDLLAEITRAYPDSHLDQSLIAFMGRYDDC